MSVPRREVAVVQRVAGQGLLLLLRLPEEGDVFTFVMEYQGKGFTEAVESSRRVRVELPRVEESPEQRRARGERAAMLEINKLAAAFFRATLADPQRGAPGRAYLARRGTSDEIAARFQPGYAPAEWRARRSPRARGPRPELRSGSGSSRAGPRAGSTIASASGWCAR
ncbi:MAG: hypothetical protein R2939_20375 [Kofleriaceae bacterium]